MAHRWTRAAAGGVLVLALGLPAAAAAQRVPGHGAAGTATAAAPIAGWLAGVSAVKARDAWAVGWVPSPGEENALIVHWNGRAWSKVTSPSLGGDISGALNAVSADSAADAWAVGYSCTSRCGVIDHILILHWNGAAWAAVQAPNLGHTGELRGVTAVSSSDAWAVGRECVAHCRSGGPTCYRTLILHWNGAAWSHVPSPSPGPDTSQGGLRSVSADSPADGWAVGGPPAETMRWNGTAWSLVSNPSPGSLIGVSAFSPADALAVGSYCPTFECFQKTVAMDWNGAAWVLDHSPNPRPSDHRELDGVSAASATDAWAVGTYLRIGLGYRTLIAHWNGTAWSRVRGPNPGSNTDVLSAVSARSSKDVWAVGTVASNPSGPFDALFLHWNGTSWTVR